MNARMKIEELKGAREYKQLVEELIRVFRVARTQHLEMDMPALVMVTASGMGNTTYLQLLAEMLKDEHLLPFSGEEEVFEWRMLADDENALARLIQRMETAAGFYPYFSGVAGIDLSDYHRAENIDSGLFELIRENRRKVLFCLMITDKQAKSFLPELEEKMRNCAQYKTVHLEAEMEDLCQYIREEFRENGYLLADNLDEPIRKLAETVGKGGYRSLRMAVHDIIWKKLNENSGIQIRADDLDLYRESRKARQDSARSRKRTIGFGSPEV